MNSTLLLRKIPCDDLVQWRVSLLGLDKEGQADETHIEGCRHVETWVGRDPLIDKPATILERLRALQLEDASTLATTVGGEENGGTAIFRMREGQYPEVGTVQIGGIHDQDTVTSGLHLLFSSSPSPSCANKRE